MDDYIALSALASCRTRHVRAKWFRRVPGLCVCLHKRQYANGRLLFQVLLPFSPVSGVVPRAAVLAPLYFDHPFPEFKRPGRLVLSFNQLALGCLYCAMATSRGELSWEPVAPDGSDSIFCQETLAEAGGLRQVPSSL